MNYPWLTRVVGQIRIFNHSGFRRLVLIFHDIARVRKNLFLNIDLFMQTYSCVNHENTVKCHKGNITFPIPFHLFSVKYNIMLRAMIN